MLRDFAIAPTIRCADIKKQVKFYTEVLGLKILEQSEGGDVMLEAGKGSVISLYPGPAAKADHTLACFAVSNLENVIKTLKSKGVKMEDYDMPGLKTVNHIAKQGKKKAAWFRDAEGNYLGLMEG
jgi:catechol 2,3-dioxygenase-like lactoylglutathione lyase family enzyme